MTSSSARLESIRMTDLSEGVKSFNILVSGGNSVLGELNKSPSGKVTQEGVSSVYDKSKTISRDTLVGIGSIGKQHTAATLLKLWDQELSVPEDQRQGWFVGDDGEIGIDVKLSKFLPLLEERYPDCSRFFGEVRQYEYFDQITLRDLLNHTHGLGARDNEKMFKLLLEGDDSPLHLSDIVRSSKRRTYGEVGSQKGGSDEIADRYGEMCYGNLGFDLAGMIIECITDREFDQAVKETLLQPYGLRSTTTQSDHQNLYQSRALNGVPVDVATGFYQHGEEGEVNFNKKTNTRAAGGMKSTIDDLDRFARLYMSGDMFIHEQVKKSFQNRVPLETMYGGSTTYHLAVEVGVDGRLGHHGNDTVFESDLRYDPLTRETEINLRVVENLTQYNSRKAFVEKYGEERAAKLDTVFVDSGFGRLYNEAGRPKPGSKECDEIIKGLLVEKPEFGQLISDYTRVRQEYERRGDVELTKGLQDEPSGTVIIREAAANVTGKDHSRGGAGNSQSLGGGKDSRF